MTNIDNGPEHAALSNGSQFSAANAKKAYSAGAAAAVIAVGGAVTTGGVFTDGKIDSTEVLTVVGAGVVAFVGAFFAAWLPTNGKRP